MAKNNNPAIPASANDHKTGKKEDNDLPGYPHYPASEDIMNPGNGFEKTSANIEDLANSRRLSSQLPAEKTTGSEAVNDEDDEIRIVPGTEADVTRDDLIILGKRDEDSDLGDDEETGRKARVDKVDSEDDLDIPGAELDDDDEETGEEDEENNYYSLGGDRNDSLEEDAS